MSAYTRIPFDIPAGLNADDTSYAATPAWVDGSNVRFRLGRPQTIGGWEATVDTLLGGVCRSILPWTDNAGVLNVAFGTHLTLEVFIGGQLVKVTPSAFTGGAVDGTGSAGFGTGAFGVGPFGLASTSDYFPITWSLGAYGQTLIASPRGQTIYQWTNDINVRAQPVTGAPAAVTFALVAPTRQVFAFGCNEEVSGVFNPLCIRHCGIADLTNWTTTASSASTAREYVLPGGGRIVAARIVGRSILVWTNHQLWIGTYYGQVGKVWGFERVGDHCGLLGPNAVAVTGATAYWVSPDRQFHAYTLGGAVTDVACPIRGDFADNLAASQSDKVMASTIGEFSEVRFDYPDARDGFENSRYLGLAIAGPDAGAWYRGVMARTAMVDAGPSAYPCGTAVDGRIYWHEKGASADGGVLTWRIKSSDAPLDENYEALVIQAWPDIADQVGVVSLTFTVRDKPQGVQEALGPFLMAPDEEALDFKVSGRLFGVEIAGQGAPSRARLGRLVFQAKLRGRK